MQPEIKPILDELKREFEAIYGDRLVKMVLFGSQARGEAGPGSDIDVLVVLRGPVAPGREVDRTLDAVTDISLAHDLVIGCAYVSADDYETRNSPLLLNVRREGVLV
jgi:predicted nucleotidyltransferase